MTVLLLNASYEPLSVVPLHRAVTLVVTGRAEIIEAGGPEVRSQYLSLPRPVVARMLSMVRRPHCTRVPLTRAALTARDGGRCQVRGCERSGDTIDHVLPRCRGGAHKWSNVVLMCSPHNNTKGARTPAEAGLELKARPRVPQATLRVLSDGAVANVPDVWRPYLVWG